jgi:glycosyltransferase involved in cell wall biosynthesis
MKVSVVVCTYSEEMYEHLGDCLDSLQNQTHDEVEIISVVDGNGALAERLEDEYGDVPRLKIHCNEENVGLSASRNNALEYATGDVIAFIDDDAVADERWVEALVDAYEEQDALAVGGQMTPIWTAGKPEFLPEEFYWLIGVTHRGFPEEAGEVRNTFGSNISFRRDVFESLGGFDETLGRKGDAQVQGEETELAARMHDEYGERVWYTPEAKVGHKIFEYRTDRKWLLERSFWQGYSKRVMDDLVDDEGQEGAFLRQLLFDFAPGRLVGLVRDPSLKKADQLAMLIVFTAAVGAGFLYGLVRY